MLALSWIVFIISFITVVSGICSMNIGGKLNNMSWAADGFIELICAIVPLIFSSMYIFG